MRGLDVKYKFLGVLLIAVLGLAVYLSLSWKGDLVNKVNDLVEKVRSDHKTDQRTELLPQSPASRMIYPPAGARGLNPGLKDVRDESGALDFLQQYRELYSNSGPQADPNYPSSITQWWQAAAMIKWFTESPVRYNCTNRVKFGNWAACQDKIFELKKPCLVYSFGINRDFSFDDAMGRRGCEVHSFDPSMHTADHQRNANVTFHDMGLGGMNSDAFVARKDGYVKKRQVWKMRTVLGVREMLGHDNRVIDVLKIDIETSEWAVIENMLETGAFDHVRQFMVEIHLFNSFPLREEYVLLYNMFRRLREYGLLIYFRHAHNIIEKPNRYNYQADIETINARYLPKQ